MRSRYFRLCDFVSTLQAHTKLASAGRDIATTAFHSPCVALRCHFASMWSPVQGGPPRMRQSWSVFIDRARCRPEIRSPKRGSVRGDQLSVRSFAHGIGVISPCVRWRKTDTDETPSRPSLRPGTSGRRWMRRDATAVVQSLSVDRGHRGRPCSDTARCRVSPCCCPSTGEQAGVWDSVALSFKERTPINGELCRLSLASPPIRGDGAASGVVGVEFRVASRRVDLGCVDTRCNDGDCSFASATAAVNTS